MTKKNLTLVYFIGVALIDLMGLGIVFTLFPALLLDPKVNLLPAYFGHGLRLTLLGIFMAVYPLGQFFGAAILGKLSDHSGRKRILLFSLAGTMIGFLASGLAIQIQSASLLFLSRLFSGLASGNIAIVQAGLSDISANEREKNRNFSFFQVALGTAWVLGPPMGGWLSNSELVSWFTYATPFWIIAFLLFVILTITAFWFKETLKQPSLESIEMMAGVKQIHHAFFILKLRIAFLIWFIFVSGWWLFESFLPTYLLEKFKFNPSQIGSFLASMGATYALFQLFVVQRFSHVKPAILVKASLFISGLSVIGIGFTHSIVALHILIILFVASMGFALPGLIVSISSLADANQQGQVMGMISSIQAVATVAMMLLGGWLEAWSLIVTVMGGGMLLVLAWLIFILHFRHKVQSFCVARPEKK